ncbi:MAG: flagellar biosynthesis protein FliS [Sulfuricurvum sp. PC08-66]|nr:MAG: flagellar biosynthesis protein FliS [Sulfuricurvum sp. PC08-66]
MRNNLAINAYTQNNAQVESAHRLIEMLYEGILRFNTQAKKALREGDIEKRVYWLNRSAAIFGELMNSLDMKAEGSTSEYLQGLYAYQLERINQANIDQKESIIDEINVVVRGLLDAWREVHK